MQGMDHSKMGGMAIGDMGMMNRAAKIPEMADNPAPDDADADFAKGMSPHLTPDAARSHFNETFNSRRKRSRSRADVMSSSHKRLSSYRQRCRIVGGTLMDERDFRSLSMVPIGFTLSVFFAVTFILCLVAALVLPTQGMEMAFEAIFPGFVWLTAPSVIVGLFWAVFYGWYIAVLFVPIRNYFFRRFP